MKFIALTLVLMFLQHSFGQRWSHPNGFGFLPRSWGGLFCCLLRHPDPGCRAKCPADQYDPGPNCSFEVICGRPSAHSHREHYCDCWCKPPLIRDTVTNACVDKCP